MVAPFIDGLVENEIRRLVAEAISNGGSISTSECVAEVRRLYPACGLSKRSIADRVILAAAAAGIAVEIGQIDDARR